MATNRNLWSLLKNLGSPDPPGKYEDFIGELQQLSIQMVSGTPEEQVFAERRIRDIKEGFSAGDKSSAESLISKTVAESIEAVGDTSLNVDQRKFINRYVATNIGLGVLKTGAGLWQVIDAAAKKRKLKLPKIPAKRFRDPQLSTMLSQAMSRAATGDLSVKKAFRDALASDRSFSAATAQTSANIGQALTNFQASEIRRNRLIGRFNTEQARRNSQLRQEATQLLNMRIRETENLRQDDFRRFGIEESRFNTSLSQLQGQMNSGLTNIFKGFGELAQFVPYIQTNTGARVEEEGSGVTPSGTFDDTNFDPGVTPGFSNTGGRGSTPGMNIAQFLTLGSRANRTPQRISSFRQQFGIGDEGQWGDKDQQVFDQIFFQNPIEFFE